MGIAKKSKSSKVGSDEADPGTALGLVPQSIPKSGRKWKAMSDERTSATGRKGVLQFRSTSYEEKKLLKEKRDRIKQLELDMINEKKEKIAEKKRLVEDRKKRIAANEYKNSVYQVVSHQT